MLVLSRKINEKIKIGEDIELTIISISGDNVRIGIQAPKDIKILRSEVLEDIKKQNLEATLGSDLGSEQTVQLSKMLKSKMLDKNPD